MECRGLRSERASGEWLNKPEGGEGLMDEVGVDLNIAMDDNCMQNAYVVSSSVVQPSRDTSERFLSVFNTLYSP